MPNKGGEVDASLANHLEGFNNNDSLGFPKNGILSPDSSNSSF